RDTRRAPGLSSLSQPLRHPPGHCQETGHKIRGATETTAASLTVYDRPALEIAAPSGHFQATGITGPQRILLRRRACCMIHRSGGFGVVSAVNISSISGSRRVKPIAPRFEIRLVRISTEFQSLSNSAPAATSGESRPGFVDAGPQDAC